MSWEDNRARGDGEARRAADAPSRFRSAIALVLAARARLRALEEVS